MHILIAPNAFKGSLGADEAAEAIARGLERSRLRCTCRYHPIADGGDGTAAILVRHFGGGMVTVPVHDPLGRPVPARLGCIRDHHAVVVELAEASGLKLLSEEERDPLRANTVGTGEMIRGALDRGAGEIILAVGGSATVDGGTGILRALGARFLNAAGRVLPDSPVALTELETVDLTRLDSRARTRAFTVLCDVANPLLGERGAARVFGPQKGAKAGDVEKLEAAMTRWSEVLREQFGVDVAAIPGGGAAGGVAAGLHAVLNAKLVSGMDYVLDLTGFDAALADADILITGEGSVDDQTLGGKAPFGAARRAHRKGVPVIALAGRVPLEPSDALRAAFDVVLAINTGPGSTNEALKSAVPNLERVALQVGNLLAFAPKNQIQ